MQQVILAIVLFLTITISGKCQTQHSKEGVSLTVKVTNVLSEKGKVMYALYNKETFMKAAPIMSKTGIIAGVTSEVVFENVSEGEYAIKCFHDANDNNQMDFDSNRMPVESYGTSNNVMSFGPPQFETSKFKVEKENISLEIKF